MDCDYIRVVRRRGAILLPTLKKKLGDHKIKIGREQEIFV